LCRGANTLFSPRLQPVIALDGSIRRRLEARPGSFMPEKVRIALDAMGGDQGASIVVPGAEMSLARQPDMEFVLFGDKGVLEPLLAAHPRLRAVSRVVHSEVTVKMDAKPSQALRAGRWKSSMWLAIDAVKKGEADVAVSAGNTGALMAMAKFNLKTMAGIERPAIAGLWPTLKGESIILDVGASIGADAQHIVDMAVMGSAMARIVFNLERPKVALLNIGVEEIKGLEEVRDAGRILREARLPDFDYVGFIEGSDIGKGLVDVVVTEGFAGNIAIKAAEGTARQFATLLKSAMSKSWRTRLGYLLAREAFDVLRDKMDPRKVNGGVFLGLNGIVIKSHGGSDVEGFASAVDIGYEMVRYGLLARISTTLEHYVRGNGGANS
jgi:glycerol-3-phosphate acyltransferase PlsX